MKVSRSLVVLLVLLCTLPAQAVVISTGDGSGNTVAPEDDPGFANIGLRGIGSAVYLGNRWVLTAAHVGAGSVTFGGVEYAHDPATTTRVENPEGYTPLTDMAMFRLLEEPPLPALHLGTESPALGSEIVLIGGGLDRSAEITFWDLTRKSGPNNDVWTVVENENSADRKGFGTQPTQSVRWGNNDVSASDLDVESQAGDSVISFQTTFDSLSSPFSADFEAQGVRGDSGGGAFQKRGDLWELTGMIHAITLHENQPDGIRTSIFGNSTYIADMSIYGDQLRAIADFEPAPGDLDGDGELTLLDIDRLNVAIRAESESPYFDLTGDGVLDVLDLDRFLLNAESIPGDADLDGVIRFADFLKLAHAFGNTGEWSDGDFTGDGQVLFGDFLVLSQNFGERFPKPSPLDAVMVTAVPEPMAAHLGLIGLLFMMFMRRRVRASLAR